MNYFKQLEGFNDYRTTLTDRMTRGEMMVYRYLMDTNNKNFWRHSYSQTTLAVAAGANVSPSTVLRAKRGLEAKGLIKFTDYGNGPSTITMWHVVDLTDGTAISNRAAKNADEAVADKVVMATATIATVADDMTVEAAVKKMKDVVEFKPTVAAVEVSSTLEPSMSSAESSSGYFFSETSDEILTRFCSDFDATLTPFCSDFDAIQAEAPRNDAVLDLSKQQHKHKHKHKHIAAAAAKEMDVLTKAKASDNRDGKAAAAAAKTSEDYVFNLFENVTGEVCVMDAAAAESVTATEDVKDKPRGEEAIKEDVLPTAEIDNPCGNEAVKEETTSTTEIDVPCVDDEFEQSARRLAEMVRRTNEERAADQKRVEEEWRGRPNYQPKPKEEPKPQFCNWMKLPASNASKLDSKGQPFVKTRDDDEEFRPSRKLTFGKDAVNDKPQQETDQLDNRVDDSVGQTDRQADQPPKAQSPELAKMYKWLKKYKSRDCFIARDDDDEIIEELVKRFGATKVTAALQRGITRGMYYIGFVKHCLTNPIIKRR